MDRRVDVRLLQTVEASLQSPHEALPQIVHRADELIRHGLVQANHDQLLDLVDARFDLPRRDGFSVRGYNDVCSGGTNVSQVAQSDIGGRFQPFPYLLASKRRNADVCKIYVNDKMFEQDDVWVPRVRNCL